MTIYFHILTLNILLAPTKRILALALALGAGIYYATIFNNLISCLF
jgi:hypothetical protein